MDDFIFLLKKPEPLLDNYIFVGYQKKRLKTSVYLTFFNFFYVRYLPLLAATFSFPQSLGILGGRPGASTYIVGVQDDKAVYLDPHEVQPVIIFLFGCISELFYTFRWDFSYFLIA